MNIIDLDNNLLVKQFKNLNINIYGTHENPLFKAKDIGELLDIKNIRDTVRDLNDSCKIKLNVGLTNVGKADVGFCITDNGYKSDTWFLTEFGLYEIIFISRKKVAKEFKKWVCEVIKEIRLKGKYDLEEKMKIKELELQITQKQLEEKEQELEKIREESKNMFFYIFKINNEKTKPGITNNLERTLNIYRRNSTNTCFEWTYEFKDVKNALICENIVKALLSNYREKYHEKTEVFNLDVNIIRDIAQTIIGIFDNTELTHEEQLKTFLKHFKEEKKEIKQIIKEEINKINKIDKNINTNTVKEKRQYNQILKEDETEILKETINRLYEKSNVNLVCLKDFYDSIYNDLKENNRELQEKLQYTIPIEDKINATMGYSGPFSKNIRNICEELCIQERVSKIKGQKTSYFLKLKE